MFLKPALMASTEKAGGVRWVGERTTSMLFSQFIKICQNRYQGLSIGITNSAPIAEAFFPPVLNTHFNPYDDSILLELLVRTKFAASRSISFE